MGLRSVNRDIVYVGCLFLEYKLIGKADFQRVCLAVRTVQRLSSIGY